jgi:hypothetical protein
MSANTELYDQDFYQWTQTTAALIRQGKWHEVDADYLAEELESLGKRDRRELESRLEVLMMHLLKWCYQPEQREYSHSWYDTILEQRGQIQQLLDDSPSLRPQAEALLAHRYARSRRRAIGETQLPEATFPPEGPWTAEQVLDDDFWPESLPRSSANG